jgi:hypothetical protein
VEKIVTLAFPIQFIPRLSLDPSPVVPSAGNSARFLPIKCSSNPYAASSIVLQTMKIKVLGFGIFIAVVIVKILPLRGSRWIGKGFKSKCLV